MDRILFTLWLTGLIPVFIWSQKVGINTNTPVEALDVNGKIKVGNDNNNASPAGTIRFNPDTGDFEGFDGYDWVPFTPDPKENFWPAYGNRGAIGSYYDYSREDAQQGDKFGYSVDIDGSYAVVGSPEWNGGVGRVFVFKREPVFGFWNIVDTLTSNNPHQEKFGFSVAISGNRIVIGAPGYDTGFMNDLGSIYIFKRIDNQWEYEISYGSFTCCSEFGYDVDINGSEILASCPNATGYSCSNPNNAGKVLYLKLADDGSINGFQHLFQPSTSPTGANRFGHSISLSGDWAVVGSPFSNASPREDSVYIYKKSTPITYQLYQSFGGDQYDGEFGYSVSVSGDRMLLGARKEDYIYNSGDDKGVVYILYKDVNNIWQSFIQAKGEDNQGYFGHSVACSSIHQMLAAHQDLTENTTEIKSFHILVGPRQPYVNISDPQATVADNKVYEISVSGNYFIVGLADGLSANGIQGGRVFFGRIR
jgi:hypothetical protein